MPPLQTPDEPLLNSSSADVTHAVRPVAPPLRPAHETAPILKVEAHLPHELIWNNSTYRRSSSAVEEPRLEEKVIDRPVPRRTPRTFLHKASPSARMQLPKLLLNLRIRELQIYLRRSQRMVSKQPLNCRQISPALIQVRREGMTQHPRRQEAKPDPPRCRRRDLPHSVVAHRLVRHGAIQLRIRKNLREPRARCLL